MFPVTGVQVMVDGIMAHGYARYLHKLAIMLFAIVTSPLGVRTIPVHSAGINSPLNTNPRLGGDDTDGPSDDRQQVCVSTGTGEHGGQRGWREAPPGCTGLPRR